MFSDVIYISKLRQQSRPLAGLKLSTCLRPAHARHASLRPGFQPGFRPARLVECRLKLAERHQIPQQLLIASITYFSWHSNQEETCGPWTDSFRPFVYDDNAQTASGCRWLDAGFLKSWKTPSLGCRGHLLYKLYKLPQFRI